MADINKKLEVAKAHLSHKANGGVAIEFRHAGDDVTVRLNSDHELHDEIFTSICRQYMKELEYYKNMLDKDARELSGGQS